MRNYHDDEHFCLSTWLWGFWAFLGAPLVFGIWVQISYSYSFYRSGMDGWFGIIMYTACLASGFIAIFFIHLHGWARVVMAVAYIPVMSIILFFIYNILARFNS